MQRRTSVTEIGRRSLGCAGPIVLGTGQILAFFHCVGTMDVLNDKLTRSARVLLMCVECIVILWLPTTSCCVNEPIKVRLVLVKSNCLPLLTYCVGALLVRRSPVRRHRRSTVFIFSLFFIFFLFWVVR